MKRLAILAVLFATPAAAQGYGRTPGYTYGAPSYATPSMPSYGSGSNPSAHMVSPHVTQNGTYVAPHMQTNPNGTQMDNYGSRGNVNPFNGAVGTRAPRW